MNGKQQKPYDEMTMNEIDALPAEERKAAMASAMRPTSALQALASAGFSDSLKAAMASAMRPTSALQALASAGFSDSLKAAMANASGYLRRRLKSAQDAAAAGVSQEPRSTSHGVRMMDQIMEDFHRANWPETVLYIRMPEAPDPLAEVFFRAVWRFAKFCKKRVDPRAGRHLVTMKTPHGFYRCDNISGLGGFAIKAPDKDQERILDARLRFWTVDVPAAVGDLVAALHSQGRDGPDDASSILATVTPFFEKLDPFPDSENAALLHAFEDRFRADALATLKRAAERPSVEPPPNPAPTADNAPGRVAGKPAPTSCDLDKTLKTIEEYAKAGANDKTKQRLEGAKNGRKGEKERAADPEVKKRKDEINKALKRVHRKVKDKGMTVSAACANECNKGTLLNERGQLMHPRTLANRYSKRYGKH